MLLTGILFVALFGGAVGAQDRLPDGPRSQDQSASETPAYFLEVREALWTMLKAKNLDPGKQAFHFVILYNAATPESAGYQKIRDVLIGMLGHYLVTGDRISLAPYQLWVRTNHADWNKPYSREMARDLYTHMPDKAEIRAGYEGGHDQDAALLEAIQQARTAGALTHTIFIALSDGPFSDTPKLPVNYKLKNAEAELSKEGIDKGADVPHYWKYGGSDTTAQFSTAYRLYLPNNLTPLTELKMPDGQSAPPRNDSKATVRDANVHAEWGNNSLLDPAKPNSVPVKPVTPGASTPADYTGLATIVSIIALLGGVGGYMAWLFQPRHVKFGVNNLRIVEVRFQKPLYLGGADNEKSSMTMLDSLPAGTPANEKVARLEVTPMGVVQLKGERWKTDNNNAPVAIGATTSKIRLSRNQTATMIGSGDSILLQIEKTR